jgi:hypothetical protein
MDQPQSTYGTDQQLEFLLDQTDGWVVNDADGCDVAYKQSSRHSPACAETDEPGETVQAITRLSPTRLIVFPPKLPIRQAPGRTRGMDRSGTRSWNQLRRGSTHRVSRFGRMSRCPLPFKRLQRGSLRSKPRRPWPRTPKRRRLRTYKAAQALAYQQVRCKRCGSFLV